MKQIAALFLCAVPACVPQHGPVKRQMVGLLEKFDRWDYNGDSQLGISELKEAEEISGLPAREIMSFYDSSGNGRISLKEAEAGMSRLDEAREKVKEIRSGQ